MILAGDVGGTKAHLALYNMTSGHLIPVRDHKFAAHEFHSLADIVDNFLSDDAEGPAVKRSDISSACFGVPGPVRDGRLKLTNLPWILDSRELSQQLSIEHLFLINDLEANGYGIPELDPDKIYTLHPGDNSAVGNRGLISAGTGLGEALLIWDGKNHLPIPSEGGHCDFAARSSRDIALLNHLRHTLNGHVSYERIVSGIGIKNVYEFLRDVEKLDEPAWLEGRMKAEDPNVVISQCAEDGSSSICFETMKTFSSAFGAEAGNLALKVIATGGIYLGGGIAPKILKTLENGIFMQSFLDKGRLSPLLQSIPVRVILDETCALLGAAAYAESHCA
jgi:glucokinase